MDKILNSEPPPELKEITKKWVNRMNLFKNHYPVDSEDISLKIIKGHLLIENLLIQFLENSVINPNYLEKADLRFYKKLNVARSLDESDDNNWAWDACTRVNNLRNAFAHDLDANDKTAEKINDFIKYVFENMKVVNNPYKYSNTLDRALYYLYDNLVLILSGTKPERDLLIKYVDEKFQEIKDSE